MSRDSRDTRPADSTSGSGETTATDVANNSTIATWSNPDVRRPQDLQSGPGRGNSNGDGQQQPQSKRDLVWEAAKTIRPSDFLELHKTPCAREGWMTGIGMGAAAGALRFILGGMGLCLGRP